MRASGAVAYVIADAVGDFDYRAMAAEMQAELPGVAAWCSWPATPGPGQRALSTLLGVAGERRALLRLPRPDPAEVATMLLSGGTTSMSKLIPRTHDDYVLNARLCAQAGGLRRETRC